MRTTVEIPISYSVDEANARLRNYFGANGYVGEQNGKETLMRGGDRMLRGIWYIAPQVMQDKVILQGFIGKPGKSEKNLDGFVGAMLKAQANTALGELQQILSGNQTSDLSNENISQSQTDQAYIPATGTIAEKNAKFAVWSVVIGAASCLIALIGGLVGAIVIFIGIWMGFSAIKTSKRTLAIIGIVLNFLAVLSIIINVILALMS